jgi:hypothetical protein
MRTINCSLTVGSPRDRGCRAGRFTGCLTSKWLVLFSVALLAVAITAVPASAQTCLQDEYNTVQKQKLNCSANDVRVAQVSNITDLSGNPLTTCVEGTLFSFIANFEVVTTANATNAGGRDNIGLYFQTDDTKPNALFGTCVDNIISPAHPCAGGTGTCGVTDPTFYKEFDTSTPTDNCGDTSSGVNPDIQVRIVVTDFLCQPPAGSTTGTLVLPNCTSWQTPGSSNLCVSNPSSYPYPVPPAAIPGSPSKCNCSTIPLNITVITPTISVAKSCNTTLTIGTGKTSCDAGEDGSTVTYHVAVTNTSTSGITVDQICDTAYGTIFQAATFTGTACAHGTVANAPATTTCTALDIAGGASKTCDFTAFQGATAVGTVTVTNSVSVSGHSDVLASKTFGPTTSLSVTVVSHETASSATVTKGTVRNTRACINVRYSVDVANTSTPEENLTLSGLNDDHFGDITSSTNASILGSTCGVATSFGTLAGSTAGGAFPATLSVGADYQCNFDAQICSDLAAGTTCFSHLNKVTATLSDDDTEGITVTQTGNTLTAQECITLTPSSATP